MKNKKYSQIWLIAFLVAGICGGLLIGMTITSLRYDAEIRTDQIELKGQVAEIMGDSDVIDGLINELRSQVELLKIEREKLQMLQEILSKGE